MSKKLSPTQLAILRFMAAGHAPFLAYYAGPPGSEGMKGKGQGYFWRQYDRKQVPCPVPGNAVNGLLARGLLADAGYGDLELTDDGRVAGFVIA